MFFLNQVKQKIVKYFKLETVFVFGDSHADIFSDINKIYKSRKFSFVVTWVGGATAQGMLNPNSITNSLEIFRNKIDTISDKNSRLIFQLGEVDTGFLIWYRAQKHNETVEWQFDRSIQNYFSFLDELKKRGFCRIYIMSAPLPTIKDNQTWGEIANLRKEVRATQLERTELTLRYNKTLHSMCSQYGFTFIDVDDQLLDIDTGLLKIKFMNKDPNNHHLDLHEYANVCYYKAVQIMHMPLRKYLYNGLRNRFVHLRFFYNLKSRENRKIKKLINKYAPEYKSREIKPDKNVQPIWILGMFRSGTSLVCDIMKAMDAKFGDDSHLLQAKGVLKDLNPNGFFENFIFAEYSRYFFHLLKSAGDNPPLIEDVERLEWKDVDIERMIHYSFNVIKDDRISFNDKLSAYESLCRRGLNNYIIEKIAVENPCVKIPMMSFLTPLILKNWPASKFLIVFRNPDSVIKSSQVLSKKSDFGLYLKYYCHLIAFSESHENVFFISYDKLLENPEYSVQQLAKALDLNGNKIQIATSKIDHSLFRNKPNDSQDRVWPEKVSDIYETMLRKAINK